MFANRISRIRKLKTVSRRHSSQLSSVYPFTKLRALPFTVSPEDAVIQMAPYASSIAMFKQFIGSLSARLLPGFGFKPFLPTRITPVYFPAWIIDAEAQVEVSMGNKRETTTAIFHDSYLPGSDFRVLSRTSLYDDAVGKLLVPFTKDLEHQYDTEISCLPYTISPFSALDIARSWSYTEVTVDENVRFSPRSLKPELFAAYPILIPLYLAQYEGRLPGQEDTNYFTVFMEAYKPDGRIFAETMGAKAGQILREIAPRAPQSFHAFTQALDSVPAITVRGTPSPFFTMAGMLTSDGTRGLARMFVSWLGDVMDTAGAAEKLAKASKPLSFDDDPRIREYTVDERLANLNWMRLSGEISSMKRLIRAMDSAITNNNVISVGTKKLPPNEIFDGPVSSLKTSMAELEKKRVETGPAWWKDWENNFKSSSSTDEKKK